ncbi:MAG TPA: hypothetical protein VFA26_22690 [Gemmataceae bacterium]|nr:hypothetical protein [Gemmataceae bacterium]
MPGREFLKVARDVVNRPSEYHRRAAFVHAYHGLFLGCRDALFRWGFKHPRRDNVHTWTRLRFAFATDHELRDIGDALDQLGQSRNQANYNLNPHPDLATEAPAQKAIQDAADPLALLDALDADPARRAAAITAAFS